MAHERKRHLNTLFSSLLKFSPITGVFGHRQVGKSTFIASQIREYRTLDDLEQLNFAHENPKRFLASAQLPLAIDECQMEPRLFPALKERVRTHKRPGQFVLSGSVRFTSRKAIRESLAGRLATLEMFPFSVAELSDIQLSKTVLTLMHHTRFSSDSNRHLNPASNTRKIRKNFDVYLENGGLPGLCFVRNPALKKSALNDLHDLMLGRDLALISNIATPITTMKRLLAHIAGLGFRPYNAAEVTRSIGIAPQTQKKILYALESVFLIRRIPFTSGKREVLLLEDQYEERIYSPTPIDPVDRLETAVYRNLRTQLGYQLEGKDAIFESYLTRDHARVPIVIRNADQTLGMIICLDEQPTLSQLRSGASFLKNNARAKLIYLTTRPVPPRVVDERSLICEIAAVI